MPFLLARRTPAAISGAALLLALAFEVFEPGSPVKVRDVDGPWLWLGLPLLAAAAASGLPRAPEALKGLAETGRLFIAGPDAGPVPLVLDVDPGWVTEILAEWGS